MHNVSYTFLCVEVVTCGYWISVCISTPVVTATTPLCPKCAAIKKSGRLSCCAPGGAWFNNCGTSGNSNTDHTWVEGMQACRDMVSLASGKAEPQFILVNQTITTLQLNDVEYQNIDSTLVHVYGGVTTWNSGNNDQISHIIVLFIVLLSSTTVL